MNTVTTNIVVLRSCDLLRFGVSSLGLLSYADERRGGTCVAYGNLDDQSLQVAQQASSVALALGCLFLVSTIVHSFFQPIPGKDVLMTLLGASIQLAMILVYSSNDNGICDAETCDWGYGVVWQIVSQILYLTAASASLYISDTAPWNNNKMQQLHRGGSSRRLSHQRRPSVHLDVGYASS
jgi:hypothetical protein